MKHFVAMAALLTSLSAFAQLPYNPDANNDGHIGAFDLTSLLSVYSGNFSNGVLGEGTQMAPMETTDSGGCCGIVHQFLINDLANSWVIDLSLVPPPPIFTLEIFGNSLSNGTTLSILKPSSFLGYGMSVVSYSVDGEVYYGDINGLNTFEGFCAKMVFWNGEWLPLTSQLSYTSSP